MRPVAGNIALDWAKGILSNKVRVKSFVAERIGPPWVLPTLWHGSALIRSSAAPDRSIAELGRAARRACAALRLRRQAYESLALLWAALHDNGSHACAAKGLTE